MTLLSHLLCLFIVWPALRLTFNAPSPRPAPRTIARQWRACTVRGGRLVAVRVQFVSIGGAA